MLSVDSTFSLEKIYVSLKIYSLLYKNVIVVIFVTLNNDDPSTSNHANLFITLIAYAFVIII